MQRLHFVGLEDGSPSYACTCMSSHLCTLRFVRAMKTLTLFRVVSLITLWLHLRSSWSHHGVGLALQSAVKPKAKAAWADEVVKKDHKPVQPLPRHVETLWMERFNQMTLWSSNRIILTPLHTYCNCVGHMHRTWTCHSSYWSLALLSLRSDFALHSICYRLKKPSSQTSHHMQIAHGADSEGLSPPNFTDARAVDFPQVFP